MTAQCETAARQAAGTPMSLFERGLTLWVALCIVVGVALGQFAPAPFQALARMEVAQVNIPVGLLIWAIKPFSMALLAWLLVVSVVNRTKDWYEAGMRGR